MKLNQITKAVSVILVATIATAANADMVNNYMTEAQKRSSAAFAKYPKDITLADMEKADKCLVKGVMLGVAVAAYQSGVPLSTLDASFEGKFSALADDITVYSTEAMQVKESRRMENMSYSVCMESE